MSTKAAVTEKLLAGLTSGEIVREMTHLTEATVRTYISRATAALSDEERAQMERARAGRNTPVVTFDRAFSRRAVLGPAHRSIGLKLLRARQQQRMSVEQFANHHGFANRMSLAAMEQGLHDFKLSELVRIAEILKMQPANLLMLAQETHLNGHSAQGVLPAHHDPPPPARDKPRGRPRRATGGDR